MRVADYIAGSLVANGIDVCFGIPGGSVEGVVDAIVRSSGSLRFVLARHETAACFQAAAYWCFSGKPAAVVTTSGAGLMNAMNGVYEAFASRLPLLVIAGAIPGAQEHVSNFQNTSGRCGSPDATAAFATTTVYARKIGRAEDVPQVMAAASRAMRGPRRGPALVILPKDLQDGEVAARPQPVGAWPIPETGDLPALLAELARAERAVVVVGEGVKRHRAQPELLAFIERTGLPVVVTPGGKDGFPNDHGRYIGITGIFGQPRANEAVRAADFLLFVGATEEPFNSFGVPLAGKRRASIHEGDGDWLASPLSVGGDLRTVLAAAAAIGPLAAHTPPAGSAELLPADGPELNTNSAIKAIGRLLPGSCNVLYDCGLVAAAAVHYLPVRRASQHELTLSSASMGFAVAGGIGAAIARPDRRTVVLTADGSLLMNGTELHTAVAEKLDLLFIVVNNSGHGIGRIAQEIFYGGRLGGTSFPGLDGCAFARALGVQHVERVERLEDLAGAVTRGLERTGVRLIEIVVAREAHPPMLSFLQQAANVGPIG